MHKERKKGIACSAALHALLLLVVIFGLPSFLRYVPPPEPAAITVELLPISKISNIKASEGTIAEKPKEEPKPEPEQKKPAPPVKTSEAAPPPPPPPEPKPDVKTPEQKKPDEKKPEQKKEEPKKPEPPKEKPKKPSKEEDLDAILKSIRDTAQKEKTDNKQPNKEKPVPTPKAISNRFDPSQMMSMSEKDAIMSQLASCWSPPAGAKNAQDLIIIVNAEFNTDGSYINAVLSNESLSKSASDSFYRAAADAALRAVRKCSPLKGLDPAKYEGWRVMELHFDPREMLQ